MRAIERAIVRAYYADNQPTSRQQRASLAYLRGACPGNSRKQDRTNGPCIVVKRGKRS